MITNLNQNNMKEFILCAAICDPNTTDMSGEPLIFCGHRHHNILHQSKDVSRKQEHQGFLTSTGRFVNRRDALEIAINNNQVIDNRAIFGGRLFSENLY